VLRNLGGAMALEMLLASQKVIPARLLQAGFNFEDAELEPALRKILRPETRQT
jgi:NAD dependent epimerase/dehydratase family enzyme